MLTPCSALLCSAPAPAPAPAPADNANADYVFSWSHAAKYSPRKGGCRGRGQGDAAEGGQRHPPLGTSLPAVGGGRGKPPKNRCVDTMIAVRLTNERERERECESEQWREGGPGRRLSKCTGERSHRCSWATRAARLRSTIPSPLLLLLLDRCCPKSHATH